MIHIEYINNIDNLDNFNSNNHDKLIDDKDAQLTDYKTELRKTFLNRYAHIINYPINWTHELTLEESKIILHASKIYQTAKCSIEIFNNVLNPIKSRLEEKWISGRWFMRLDALSPKDSNYKMPYTNPSDIINSIVTSKRTFNALLDNISLNINTKLYFVTYNENWKPSHELRCFVYNKKITAISQYCWTKEEYYCDKTNDELIEIATKVNYFITNIIDNICAQIDTTNIIFDLYLNDDLSMNIIELNCFGYWLASGSALFHWIRDKDKLYNTDGNIYFRILKNLSN
ncbi:division cycle 123 [Acanthamoeba polyphaga mimivirus]|uniref:Division cycle 123 n=1 Tax=Acanthamoeba polyphaga mimivirus TaxID=212035 RepID=A0A2L2DK27_MIMIV|nr:division cycle 123 [Acanthamoeba polyphaga mimivirus]